MIVSKVVEAEGRKYFLIADAVSVYLFSARPVTEKRFGPQCVRARACVCVCVCSDDCKTVTLLFDLFSSVS